MPEHTPGPWSAPLYDGHTTGLVWAEEPHGGPIASISRAVNDPDVACTADAHLIAAAPDLLAALEQLVFRVQLSPEDAWIETAALDAIATAKGQPPRLPDGADG